jgi:CspA family cold shock protein
VAYTGTVRSFDPDEGYGVLDGPDVPGGCWVHFSAIAVSGYRQLIPGQQVSFRVEAAEQDGFTFRATKVWTGSVEPADESPEPRDSGAYGSVLTLDGSPRDEVE